MEGSFTIISAFSDGSNVAKKALVDASRRVTITGDAAAVPVPVSGTIAVSGTVAVTQSGTWNINNISGTISLPTGAATAANQTTEITSLQLIDDIVHTQDSALSKAAAIGGQFDDASTATVTENNVAVVRITASRGLHTNLRNASGAEIGTAGSPLRTDPTGSTTQPVSGTVSISGTVTVSGTVTANQGGTWNINNISGTVSLPTGAATEATLATRLADATFTGRINTQGQKAMSASTPVVIASDQSAIPASQSGTWNINNISGTISLPTGAATSANQSTIITALQIIDNLPHAADVAFNNGAPIMGQLDDTATGTVTENNVGVVRITAARALHMNLRNVSGTEIGTSGAPLRIDPTGTTNQGVVGSLAIDATLTTNPVIVGGRASTAAPSDVSGDGDVQALWLDRKGATVVVGGIAHDGVDAGNPIKVGGKASTSEPSAVANADRVDAYFDDKGYQHAKTRPVEDAGTTPTNINTTYNNTTTTATSADITKITGARTLLIIMTLAKANTPQDIEFFIDGKDGSNYFPVKTGILAKWIYDDTFVGSGKDLQIEVPAPGQGTFRMRAVAQGTDATNTFTITNCKIFQRT